MQRFRQPILILIFFSSFSYIGPDLLDLILAARGDDQTTKFNDEEIYEEALTFGACFSFSTENVIRSFSF